MPGNSHEKVRQEQAPVLDEGVNQAAIWGKGV